MISQNTIQEVAQRLIKAYNPLSIYLFGSYAWGTPRDDSDLNILVVIESSNEELHKRCDKALDALSSLKIRNNIIVFTKKEFDKFSQDLTSLTYEIKSRGKMLYARG